jgi:hypothetical protein
MVRSPSQQQQQQQASESESKSVLHFGLFHLRVFNRSRPSTGNVTSPTETFDRQSVAIHGEKSSVHSLEQHVDNTNSYKEIHCSEWPWIVQQRSHYSHEQQQQQQQQEKDGENHIDDAFNKKQTSGRFEEWQRRSTLVKIFVSQSVATKFRQFIQKFVEQPKDNDGFSYNNIETFDANVQFQTANDSGQTQIFDLVSRS